jgi:hypothetical protein
MKLDQSDYENIFLRVRDKLLIQVFAIFSILFAVIGIATWTAVKARVEKITELAVNNYVQSDEFKKHVVVSYQEKLTRLETQTAEITKVLSEQQKKAAQLSEIPILIDQDGLTLINKNGHQFRIEMGSAISGAKVLFKVPY